MSSLRGDSGETGKARGGPPLVDDAKSFDRQRLAESRIKFEQHRAKDGGTRGHFKAPWHPGHELFDRQFFLHPDYGMERAGHPNIRHICGPLRETLIIGSLYIGMRTDHGNALS